MDELQRLAQHPEVLSGEGAQVVAQVLIRQYGEFHGHAVEQIFAQLAGISSGPLARIRTLLQPDVEATMAWRRRLSSLANERLGNSLVDAMKATNMPLVTQCLKALIGTGTTEEERKQRARQAGSLLGGLLAERERSGAYVRTVAAGPARFGLTPVEAMALFEEYTRSAASAYNRQRTDAAAMRLELTQTVVELSRALPGRMELREPNEGQVHTFERQVRALLRCAVCSPDHVMLPDVILVLSDFAPRSVSSTGAMAGAEQRLWMTLGRTARMTCIKVFTAVGQNTQVARLFLEYATEHAGDGTRMSRSAVESLGVLFLSNAESFLIRQLQARGGKVRMEAAYALGAIAGDKGLDALLSFLKEMMSMKVLDVDNKRLAFSIVEAVGRTLRKLEPAARNSLTERILKTVPAGETDFKVAVLTNFFWTKLDSVDSKLRDWAAKNATEMLWLPDNHLLAIRGANTPLGWRQPLVDLLIRLMPTTSSVIAQVAMENLGRYCGAYLALGELCGRAPSDDLIPLLRRMVIQIGLQSDDHHGARDAYKQETVFDPTAEAHVPLTRDAVLASVVHAVSQQKNEEAEEFLSEIYQMAQSKRLPMPGRESASILMEAHMNALKRRGASSTAALQAVGAEPPVKKPANLSAMLNDLSASFWFKGKRRQRRVAALAALATVGERAAVPRMIELLSDEDNVIAGAALTALTEMLKPLLKDEGGRDMLTDGLLRELVMTPNSAGRDRIAGLLMYLKPEAPPLREKLERILSDGKTPQAAKLALARTVLPRISAHDEMQAQQDHEPGSASRQTSRTDDNKDAATDEQLVNLAFQKYLPTKVVNGQPAAVSALDKKRAYTMARQEWIRNGKRGPEPQPPQ